MHARRGQRSEAGETTSSAPRAPQGLPSPGLGGRGLWSGRPPRALEGLVVRQDLLLEDAQTLHGVVPMDLGDVQLLHVVQDIHGDDLSRHDDGEAGRVRDDEGGAGQYLAIHFHLLPGLSNGEELAVAFIEGQIKGVTNAALIAQRVLGPEGRVELGEVRQQRVVLGEAVHGRPPDGGQVPPGRDVLLLELVHALAQALDEERRGGESRADVRLEQHGVAGRLVHLDVALVHQPVHFEVVAVDPGLPGVQREARGVQHKLILRQPSVLEPVDLLCIIVEVVLAVGLAELRRDEIAHVQEPDPLLQVLCAADVVPQVHGVPQHVHRELKALQLHLGPPHVQRRQDLVVGRRTRVSVVCLLERCLGAPLEDLVKHVDHGALPERCQRLVRGLGDVHSEDCFLGLRVQPYVQQLLMCRRVVGLHQISITPPELLAGILEEVRLHVGQQPIGSPHPRPPLQNGMEAGVCVPGFIPQEAQVRLDGQALLHDALHVVHNAVKRAVGQHDQLDLVQLAASFVLKELLLDVT
mmetsp:Transcript_37921/g.62881  ORF Transcript_37921/g.62881 Transcript_37921/m.62881 type:complete len:524 (+) Transcript_37921:261-1832(+)